MYPVRDVSCWTAIFVFTDIVHEGEVAYSLEDSEMLKAGNASVWPKYMLSAHMSQFRVVDQSKADLSLLDSSKTPTLFFSFLSYE